MGRATAIACIFLTAALGACEDMASQPAHRAQDPAPSLPGGLAEQPPVAGTVARGDRQPVEDAESDRLTRAMLERGRERFETFCAPCHDAAGTGQGIVVQRGFPEPPSLHAERLRQAPDRYIVDVITHGIGDMYPFAGRVSPEDRWAIAAYIRALQLSQRAPVDLLDEDDRRALEAQ